MRFALERDTPSHVALRLRDVVGESFEVDEYLSRTF